MADTGVIIAVFSGLTSVVLAILMWIRFLRKDRADTIAVESGTISGRFKDADALARYINERVDAETRELRDELKQVKESFAAFKRESDEIHGAVRANFYQQWLWNQSGRTGAMPNLPTRILAMLGIADPLEDTHPTLKEQS